MTQLFLVPALSFMLLRFHRPARFWAYLASPLFLLCEFVIWRWRGAYVQKMVDLALGKVGKAVLYSVDEIPQRDVRIEERVEPRTRVCGLTQSKRFDFQDSWTRR